MWQSSANAKDLNPLPRGSNPLPSFFPSKHDFTHSNKPIDHNSILHNPNPNRRGLLNTCRTKNPQLHTGPKGPKHCGPFWSTSTHCRRSKTLYQRAHPPIYLLPFPLHHNTHPSPTFSPHNLNTPPTPFPPCRLKSRTTIFISNIKPNCLLLTLIWVSL